MTLTEYQSAGDVDPDCLEAAKAFYQAYLDHDAEAVYSMFDKAEIDGYNELSLLSSAVRLQRRYSAGLP